MVRNWYQQAADDNNVALCNLGQSYELGQGVYKNKN
jgi:hypothetical protein